MGLFTKKKDNLSALMAMRECLEEKLRELMATKELTEDQSYLIENDEVDELLNNIQARQEHIDKVNALEQTLADMARQYNLPEKVSAPAEIEEMNRVTQVSAEIEEVLTFITQQDKINERMAQEKLNEYKLSLKQVSDGKRMLGAYYAEPIINDGFYIDKRN